MTKQQKEQIDTDVINIRNILREDADALIDKLWKDSEECVDSYQSKCDDMIQLGKLGRAMKKLNDVRIELDY